MWHSSLLSSTRDVAFWATVITNIMSPLQIPNLTDSSSYMYDLYLESDLGYSGSEEFGFETITL